MITLLLSLFASGGGVALGGILKSITGVFDSASHRKELNVHREILRESKDSETTLAFQKAVFGDSDTGMFAVHTRRILALIGVSTLAIVTIHCVLFSYDPFITLPSVASSGDGGSTWNFLFGLVSIPRSNQPIQLTLGHLALMNLGSLQMVLGFYFGGRK